jgi:hypothetical protein
VNPLDRALYSEMFTGTSGPVNTPRFVFSAEPGSAAEDGLKLLSSWSATAQNSETPQVNAEN